MGLTIYSATLNMGDALAESIRNVLADVATERVCGVVLCGTSDTKSYHELLVDVKSALHSTLPQRVPTTLIPQPLLPCGGLSLQVYMLDGQTDIRIEEHNGISYGVVDNQSEQLLFIEGIPASDFSESVAVQSNEVFAKLDSLLHKYGFEVDDIVRQWNYIGNIVSYRGNKQNYQEFNDVRSAYYARCEWKSGYPAATGIGAEYEGIIVGAIAFKRSDAAKAIFPIDNPLQVAAHIYSKRVLIDEDANAIKSTPKFERAKLIESSRGAICFVSGTAAIRGEDSVDASSAELQTIRTIENIEHLVSKENLVRYGCKPYDLRYAYLHIYIKRAEDYDVVKRVVERAYPGVATLYSVADVCRGELLVEIEGILTL